MKIGPIDGITPNHLMGAAAALAVLVWWVLRDTKPGASFAVEAGAAAGQAAVGAALDMGAGIVQGVGQAVGIPRTDEDECTKALREGRMWDASFACPASRFLGAAIGG